MQHEMSIDFLTNHILNHVKIDQIFNARFYLDATNYSDLFLTTGEYASIYEIREKHLLASFSLTKTILRGKFNRNCY